MTKKSNGIDIEYIDDRRDENRDRRDLNSKTDFPLVDSNGRHVKSDRRNSPERRLANIKVKEEAVNGEIFDTLFK